MLKTQHFGNYPFWPFGLGFLLENSRIFLKPSLSLNRELSQMHVISHGEPSELSKERISQRKCCEQVSESEEQEL